MENGSGDCSSLEILNTSLYFIIGDDNLSNLVLAVLRSPQFTAFMARNHYILHITMANSRDALAFQETYGYGLPPIMYVFGARGILIRTMELDQPMIRSLAFDEGTAFPMLTATIRDIVTRNFEENFLRDDDSVRPNAPPNTPESSEDSDHSSYGGPLWSSQFNAVNAPLYGAHLSPFTIFFRNMRSMFEIVAPPLTRMYEAIVSFFENLYRTPAAPMQEQEAVQEQEIVQVQEAVQVQEIVQVQEAVQEQEIVQVQEAVQEQEIVQVQEAVQEQEIVQVQEAVQEEDDAVQEPRAPAVRVRRRRNMRW